MATISGAANDDTLGPSGDPCDVFVGNAGGTAGTDSFTRGAGNDLFLFNDLFELVTLFGGGGSVTLSLSSTIGGNGTAS